MQVDCSPLDFSVLCLDINGLSSTLPPMVGTIPPCRPPPSRAESLLAWLNHGLAFLYPQVCQLCRLYRATPAEGFVCTHCRGEVRRIQRPFCECCGYPYPGAITQSFVCANCRAMDYSFRYARSAVAAQGILLEVIHRYKYNRALWFEPFLSELFVAAAAPDLQAQQWDGIVPVPLHPLK